MTPIRSRRSVGLAAISSAWQWFWATSLTARYSDASAILQMRCRQRSLQTTTSGGSRHDSALPDARLQWHVGGTSSRRNQPDQRKHLQRHDMQKLMVAVLVALQEERDRQAEQAAEQGVQPG